MKQSPYDEEEVEVGTTSAVWLRLCRVGVVCESVWGGLVAWPWLRGSHSLEKSFRSLAFASSG
jgi:hypothetical protein